MSTSKKVRSSVMIHEDVWQDIQILAIREGKNISELVEEIFRERLAKAYKQQKEQFQIQPQPQQLQPQQLTSKQQHKGDEHEYGFRISAPGLKFPINKKGLMNLSRADYNIADFGTLYHYAQNLPDKTYKNKAELEKDLVNAFNNDMGNRGKPERIAECIIINDEKSKMDADAARQLEELRKNKMDATQYLAEQRRRKHISQTTERKSE